MQTIHLKSLLSKMAVLTSSRVIGAACLFLITLIISRQFGANAMAHYSLFLAILGLLAVILPLGFQAFGSMITAEYAAHKKEAEIGTFVRYGQSLIIKVAVFLTLPLLTLAFLLPDPNGYQIPLTGLIAFIAALGMAFTYWSGCILVGLEEPLRGQLPDILIRPTTLLVGFVGFGLIWPNITIFALLTFAAAVYWLVAGTQYLLLRRKLGHALKTAPAASKTQRQGWKKLAPNWLVTTLLWDTFIEIHILLAVWLVSPYEVALLHICFRIRQLAGFGMRSLYSLLLPKVYAANAKRDDTQTKQLIRLATRITLLYAIAVWIFVAQFGPVILGLFGPKFEEGHTLLLIILGTLVVRALFGPGPAILGMKRRQDMIVKILVSSLAVSILVALFGLSIGGVTAIASAYLAATTYTAITMWWSLKFKSNIDCAVWA